MRYILAAIILSAVAAPAAFALPAASPDRLSLMKASPVVQVAKRNRTSSAHHRRSLGGIHPLVGSGDY